MALDRGAGYFKPETYTVVMSKDGCERSEVTITRNVSGWYIGNIDADWMRTARPMGAPCALIVADDSRQNRSREWTTNASSPTCAATAR